VFACTAGDGGSSALTTKSNASSAAPTNIKYRATGIQADSIRVSADHSHN
jgi:hypothetical protein